MQKQILNNRPKSLNQVVMCSRFYGNTYALIREFLDEFYTETNPELRQQMLCEEPQLETKKEINAYLAAIAEHLSLKYQL